MSKSQFIEMFGNPVTNSKGYPTKKLSEVAPESPSKHEISGKVWNLNLDMIESNSGKVVEKVYSEKEELLSVSQFDEGNVLYSKLRPYLNKVVIPDSVGYGTTELVPLRPDAKYLTQEFLAHLLRGKDFVTLANTIATGTKMPRMPMNSLRQFDCILPPIDEQNQFANLAAQADKSKFVRFKSQFIEMFGSISKVKLADYIQVIRGVSYKPNDVLKDCGAIILRSNNISDGELNTDEIVYVNPERVSTEQNVQIGDIVVCASNGSKSLVGKAAINRHLTGNIAHGAFCLLVRPKVEMIDPLFLNVFFQTPLYKEQIDALAAGSNILNIKPGHLNNLDIPIPSMDKQKYFVQIANQADKSKYVC